MSLPAKVFLLIYPLRIDRHFGPLKASFGLHGAAVSQDTPRGFRDSVPRLRGRRLINRRAAQYLLSREIKQSLCPLPTYAYGARINWLPWPGHRIILAGSSLRSTHSTSYSCILKGFVDTENESDLFSLASRRKFARELIEAVEVRVCSLRTHSKCAPSSCQRRRGDLPSCRRLYPGRT